MTFRYYKRVNLGGGLHLNFSKTGIGISGGIPGARYSVHSSGRTVRTVGLPGTGVYFRKDSYAKGTSARRARSGAPRRAAIAAPVVIAPKAGLFASKQDKAFVNGVGAYMLGKHEAALEFFRKVEALDDRQAHVGEELIAGLCLVALGRLAEAAPQLETVVASHQPIPDALMQKYRVGGQVYVQVTPEVAAALPMSSMSAALLLAEVYQHTEQPDKAIELLESLGSVTGQPVCALSLAELYSRADRFDEVLRVSEDFLSNADNVTAQLLVFRASALADKGLVDAALTTLKEAMRFRSRDAHILRQGRYVRAGVYERAGRKALAKKDLERIYAEEPGFLDVAVRLGAGFPPAPPRPDM